MKNPFLVKTVKLESLTATKKALDLFASFRKLILMILCVAFARRPDRASLSSQFARKRRTQQLEICFLLAAQKALREKPAKRPQPRN